jgi:glycosyltransferase involved in cell wall biosynthesis
LCKRHNIDILHAHLHKSVASCLLAGVFCKKPLIIHEHGEIFQKGLTYAIYRLLLRLLKSRAQLIIANSQAAARELLKKTQAHQDFVKVLYNAVDFRRFDLARISRADVRSRLGFSENDFVIGFVGRLHHVKGVDLLVEVLSLLLEKSRRYLLVFVGDGPCRQLLETMARSLDIETRVKFLNARDDVAALMAGFDVGVVPSRHESFGITAVEFMRMKVPVVCSGVEGLAELVTNQVTGLATQENTPAEIARCIERLVNDPDLRKTLAESAYDFSERFSITDHVKEIEKLYNRAGLLS